MDNVVIWGLLGAVGVVVMVKYVNYLVEKGLLLLIAEAFENEDYATMHDLLVRHLGKEEGKIIELELEITPKRQVDAEQAGVYVLVDRFYMDFANWTGLETNKKPCLVSLLEPSKW